VLDVLIITKASVL